MLSIDPCEERWSKVPADMLVIDVWLRVKIMIFIEKGGGFHLLREVRAVRHSWVQDQKLGCYREKVIGYLLQLSASLKLEANEFEQHCPPLGAILLSVH